ncbi:MAG: thioesterase family protein [Aquabacterium sp.]
MSHAFDSAIRLEAVESNRFVGATSPAYANMVGPFGGITTAALLNAILLHPQRQGEPISLTVNFLAPIADGPFEIDAEPVRSNRSTQHWTLQLLQQGALVGTATAVFAQRRSTWSASEAEAPQGMPPAADLRPLVTTAAPTWVQRYDMRFAQGGMPEAFDGVAQTHAHTQMWVRDEPPRPLDFPSLASICDSFFPRIFIRRRALTPIGTVSLTVFFHADAALLAEQGERHVLACARALAYRNGYYDQSAEVWSDAGQLLASTHQMVYYRE